jgi:glycine C-acetyltransferase/8-amino-7-oxononanoate synthase
VYDHGDAEHLEWAVERAEGRGALIVTESVFSTDGDLAPLPEIVEIAHRHELRTVIDEAHATGTVGPEGRGALALAGLEDQVDVIVGALSRALGGYGAFVTCDRQMARYLINVARTFVFSTALPPPAVAAGLAALELLQERPQMVRRLAVNAGALRSALEHEGFDIGESPTQILPLVVGDPERAARFCEEALSRGVFAQAIRPPAVPPTSSRLRLTVMATHREGELRSAARTLAAAARAAGVEPRFAGAGAHARQTVATAAEGPGHSRPEGPGHSRREGPGHSRQGDADGPRAGGSPARGGVFDFDAPEPVRRAA